MSGSSDCTIRLWEKEGDDWVTKFVLKGHTEYVFSITPIQTPTGTQIVSGSGDKTIRVSGSNDNTIRLWEPTIFLKR